MTNVYNPRSRHTASTATITDRPSQPSSISELAERALTNLWDPSKDFKHWLRVAERARNTGKEYVQLGDLENAFVEYAKAAALILDKMPTHREYMTRLNANQRESLTLHGQDMLKQLSHLKPTLTDRHNAWYANQASGSASSRPQQSSTDADRKRADEEAAFWEANDRNRQDGRDVSQREDPRYRDRERRSERDTLVRQRTADQKREDIFWTVPNSTAARQEADAAEKRRREELLKARMDEKTRAEQMGIAQRQREAESEARAAREGFPVSRPPHMTISASQSSSRSNDSAVEGLPILPLESPTRYDGDSTDTEKTDDADKLYRRMARLEIQQQRPPVLQPFAPPVFPPPITTTSPPPPTFETIHYPQLMSHHQKTQGYAPSLQSMFVKPIGDAPPSSLLFEHGSSSTLYSNMLPPPSRPLPQPSPSSYLAMPVPGQPSTQEQPRYPQAQYFEDTPPPRPPKEASYNPSPIPEPASRIIPADNKKDSAFKELRTVNLPRDTLPRFISIASLNTARNRETCGLLLGKSKGEKFVVTTLLIPKQHSTSDTCAMDEEELVLEFTEQRALITLGWIHTHPTQSCFMSSVDLHTHSGFQRMLPESFAVVCAPQSTPNFGIFRLTDPPGLQTILKCNAKEAFHPHPDVPIYTDADKGHVQMRDMSLEIVDLR